MGCASSSTTVAGGFVKGDHVYYGGAGGAGSTTGRGGSSISGGGASQPLAFGAEGEVVGQTCGGTVIVQFQGGRGRASVRPLELSRKAPTIPGGYALGEKVFYGGPARKYPNGDQLWFSTQGHVAGRSCVGDGMDSERLAVMFPQHRDAKAVRLALLSRQPPVIPGGYSVGDRVYWCGMNWTFPNGDRLKFGAEGEVAGRSCVGDGLDDERVAVNFARNKGAVAMRLPEISHEPPNIPGGYCIGDRVFYAYPNWRAPDGHVLRFGVQGKVIGRSCIGDGKDDERVWVLFPGLGYGCICLEQISRDPPVIPGGYNLGDRVYYGGPSRPAGVNGDRLSFGALGEVAGRATSSRASSRADVAVVFPGNEDAADVRLAEIGREIPVIPGGYNLGDKIFYTGMDWSYANGDRLTYGAQGEIAGRSCQGDDKDNERAAVLMPGNRAAAHLRLTEMAQHPPVDLATRLEARLRAALEGRPWQDTSCIGSSTGEGVGAGSQAPAAAVSPPVAEERSPGGGEGAASVPEIRDLAIVFQTASGAELSSIAESAQKASFAQVASACAKGDMARLSEIGRAAEDTDWLELRRRAKDALEEVALPKVLEAAIDAGDVFGLLAVEQKGRAKGFYRIVEKAVEAIEEAEISTEDLYELRSSVQPPESLDGDLNYRLVERTFNRESSADMVEHMQQLLDETYTGWGGFGKCTRTRDRPNERVAERLEVERVVQLQNLESYLNYLVRRQVVFAELPDGLRRDWNVRTNSGDLSPSAASIAEGEGSCKSFLNTVDADLNEHYLWHGTGPSEAQGIAARGFDMDQAGSSRGALFGRGLYFAESCLKADEYVRPDDKGCYPLILCRVTLGNVNYCDAEDPWELRETLRVSCRAGVGGYHSVLGDREKVRQTFREFVVFDGHQAYPEYIVWYSRK
mmetsp:Transcript_7619/g.19449  ORF Transcript_7619/g.19449 Transcript_7619/m.19449 type:complete len:914 (+) Transcript_7619:103-2844(+)